MVMYFLVSGAGFASACVAPVPPYVPRDSQKARDYRDILRRDFEIYLRDAQAYFRCLEAERTRAFEEVRDVSEAYGRFLKVVGD